STRDWSSDVCSSDLPERLDDAMADREAEPRAAVRARRRAVELPERLEGHLQFLGRDPRALVGDLHDDAVPVPATTHPDPSAPRGEFDRVRYQIDDHLFHAAA